MSAHTPGPWWFGISCEPERGPVDFDYSSGCYSGNPAIFGANGEEVVGCTEYNVFSGAADVRLIAAAPDLLEALQRIAAYRPLTFAECSDAEAVIGIAEAAIAKATGDT